MAVSEDDGSVDDIWDYAPEIEVIPLSDSDVEEKPPPEHTVYAKRPKRKKFKPHAEPIFLISSSSDEEGPKTQLDVRPVPNPEDFMTLPPPRPRRTSEVEDRGALVMERYRLAMEMLQAAGVDHPEDLSQSPSEEASHEKEDEGDEQGAEANSHPAGQAAAAPAAAAPAVAADRIRLSCKSATFDALTLRLTRTDPLQKLMATYRKEACRRGWLQQPGGNLIFRFDGDNINGSDTAAGLDMEDDDVIDVTFT